MPIGSERDRVSHRIEFSPEALADLLDLYDYIAPRACAARAIGYIDRIEDFCHSLSTFPSVQPGATIFAPVSEIRPSQSRPNRGSVRSFNRVVKQDGKVAITYTPLRMVKARSRI